MSEYERVIKDIAFDYFNETKIDKEKLQNYLFSLSEGLKEGILEYESVLSSMLILLESAGYLRKIKEIYSKPEQDQTEKR